MKALLFLAAVVTLAGCAAPRAESPADQAIAAWMGRPIEAVIASWGPPSEETFEGARHLYLWEASHYDRRFYPGSLPAVGHFPSLGGRGEIACKGVFSVDETGRVVEAQWQGYECHFLP